MVLYTVYVYFNNRVKLLMKFLAICWYILDFWTTLEDINILDSLVIPYN